MSPTSNKLGRAITRHRKAAGLSISECAGKVGVAKSILHYWETGERVPKAPNLQRLAAVVGVDFEELFDLAGYAPGKMPEFPLYLRKTFNLNESEAERVGRYVERIRQQKKRQRGQRHR
jgi:transcriptional regulator with XRE-family HTH domain